MAILTLDDYLAAKKQRIVLNKTASITAVGANQSEVMHLAGNPGGGTLAGGSTSTGAVPTDATTGFPVINAFDGGATGYLTGLEAWAPVAMNLTIYDMLWKGGTYPFNSTVNGQTSTSYSTRVPSGTDYNGTELWAEAVTAFTGNATITITYLDQGGAAGTTGAVATGIAPIIGRMIQFPLAAGDSGVSGITGSLCTVSTVGTYNVLVLRPLAKVRIPAANFMVKYNLMDLGCPRVFADSALIALPTPDSTATSTPWVNLEISNK